MLSFAKGVTFFSYDDPSIRDQWSFEAISGKIAFF